MKKSLFPLLLAGMLAACTNNDPGFENNGNLNVDENLPGNYLSIKLVAPGNLTTRADGKYQYGSEEENYVKEVRFFFFTEEDKAAQIRKNPIYDAENAANGPAYFSYYDWTPTPDENKNGQQGNGGTNFDSPTIDGGNGTVEKVLTTMVVLNFNEDDKDSYPTQIVAIINPTPSVKKLVNPDLDALKSEVDNYLDGFTTSNFVMSNSVYIDENKALTITQPVTEENLCTTQPEAQKNPLVVYVERVVARLDLAMEIKYPEGSDYEPKTLYPGTDNEVTIYPIQTNFTSYDRDFTPHEDDQDVTPEYNNEPLYVKFLGWAVTSTPNKSNLVKNITTDWGEADKFFGVENEPWYVPGYHRSFWAMNPASITSDPTKPDESYVWFNYNELTGMNNTTRTGFPMSKEQTYMHENANPFGDASTPTGQSATNPTEPTKVIYAAQIVKDDGTPVTVADWNGVTFTLQGLKDFAASKMDMYYKNPEGKWTRIVGDQITFITASQFRESEPIFSEKPNYYVYATLTSDKENPTDPIKNAAGLSWFHLNDNTLQQNATDTDYTAISSENINNYMADVFDKAQVWNNGYTYYFYEIHHLGATSDAPGFVGVVRNHIYSATVNKLKGLGTPVWDPKEDIYPEKTDPDGNNISAELKILTWRLVSEGYEFDW